MRLRRARVGAASVADRANANHSDSRTPMHRRAASSRTAPALVGATSGARSSAGDRLVWCRAGSLDCV